jgi:hypothetical protein
MAATSPTPDEFDETIPPPVYEVEEQLVERRIRSVPIPNDRRGNRGPAPSAPDEGKTEGK